ncbi:MAG: hypothetical protein WBC06_15205 [Chitinophagaceae bacterium]
MSRLFNKHLILFSSLLLIAFSCKTKQKEEAKKYISVLSIIEKQVAHIDTSLYSIQKIIVTDSIHSDTTYIAREDFRTAAKDFLDIPDLSQQNVANRFKAETRFDSLIQRVIITYSPVNPKIEEIQKQELLVSQELMPDSTNKVTNIIIEKIKNNREGFWSQKMLWRTDKSFLIITTTQKPGEPEKITTVKVVWNEE